MLFKDKYFFLSNFYPAKIELTLNGKVYSFLNSEAGFQAQKNIDLAQYFERLQGKESKDYGQQIPITTENWEQFRLYAMANVLNAKFKNPDLFFKLKQVEGEIVEDNYWKDYFWGVCQGKGKNMLGKLLMCVRDSNNNLKALYNLIDTQLLQDSTT